MKKGVCDYCQAGEDKLVPGIEVEVYANAKPGLAKTFMCLICHAIGLSAYQNQNDRPVTPVDLARAIRVLLTLKKF